MIKTIKTSKGIWHCVPVPVISYDHWVYLYGDDDRFHVNYKISNSDSGGFVLLYKDFGGKQKYPTRLDLVCLTTDITEKQAVDVVDADSIDNNKYKVYTNSEENTKNALHSFYSLMENKGIVGPHLLLKQYDYRLIDISKETKARIFMAYWAAKVIGIKRERIFEMGYNNIESCINGSVQLVLRPLKYITIEDAKVIAKFMDGTSYLSDDSMFEEVREFVSDWRNNSVDEWEKLQPADMSSMCDYLRSKSYDIGYGSIPSLIDARIAVSSMGIINE